MEFRKVINLLGKTIDSTNYQSLPQVNGLKFFISRNGYTMLTKMLDLKHHN